MPFSPEVTRELLRIHSFLPRSRANGPGLRAVLWVQGCPLRCPGCCNPHMQDAAGGQTVAVGELAQTVAELAPEIDGLTLSGGEPLAQLDGVTALVREVRVRAPRLSLVLFSGYTWEEIQAQPAAELLSLVDVVIAGRYDQTRGASAGLLASGNQTVHLLSGRYGRADLDQVPDAEIAIDGAGTVVLTGIRPPPVRV